MADLSYLTAGAAPPALTQNADTLAARALLPPAPVATLPTGAGVGIGGAGAGAGSQVYDPAKGGWIYPDGTPAPKPLAPPGAWRGTAGTDVNGNPIPSGAYQSQAATADPPSVVATGLGGLNNAAGNVIGGLGGVGGTPVDTKAISDASARATALSAQYEAERRGYQPIAAPTATAQQIQGTNLAAAQAPIQAGQSEAQQIQSVAQAQREAPISSQQVQAAIAARQGTINAQDIPVERARAVNGIEAQQVTAAQQGRTVLGPTALADSQQLAPAALAAMSQLAPASQANAANINQDPQVQFRAQQMGLVSGLNGAIAGTDPSVASIMLRQATDRNIANQYALAQAATGQNTGLAQRQAMIGAADVNQQSIGQQALLRAQEIATARGQLGSVVDAGRGQDVGLATSQAGLQQQTALANQAALNSASQTQFGADVQTKLANAGFLNTQSMTQAQLSQAVALANAGFKNTATTTQAQLDAAQGALNVQQKNSVGLANAGNALQANTTNAQLGQQVNLANAAAQNDANKQFANNALQAGTTNATLAQQVALANQASQNTVGLGNAGNALDASKTNATLGQQVAIANAGAANNMNQVNAQLGTQAGIANAGNTTQANTASSQLANQVALANAAAQNDTSKTNAQLGTQTNIANAGNATTTNAQNITAKNDLAQNALQGSATAVTGAIGAANAQAEQAKAAAAIQAAKYGAAAAGTAAIIGKDGLISDRRAKTDISDAGPDMGEFMNAIKASGWRYKDPSEAGAAEGEQFGAMAQDLEKSRVGRTLVHEREDGRKVVDPNRAAMVALAALAALNKRTAKLEERR